MRTYSAKPQDIKRDWLIVDAKNHTIGRLASQVAAILRGKHKTTFTPHEDTGDVVVVINAADVQSTGKKEKTKIYHSHTGYPGGLRSMTLGKALDTRPERVVEEAITGMMPHNKLSRASVKKLHVFAGSEHPYAGQQPETYEIKQVAQ